MAEKTQRKNDTEKKMEEGFLPFDFFESEEKAGRKKKKPGKDDLIPDLFSVLEAEGKRSAPETEKCPENPKSEAVPENKAESSALKGEKFVEKAPESDIIIDYSEKIDGTAQDFKIREKVEEDEYFPEDDIKFEISYSEAENTKDENTETVMAENEIRPTGEDIPGLENADEIKARAAVPEKKPEAPETVENTAVPGIVRDKNPGTKVPFIQKPFIKTAFSVKNKNASPGQILQEGRTHSGLSIGQVEQITKIRLSYLEAIEHDDFPKLPPAVYATAYVKTLCSLYGISADDSALILSNMKKSGEKPVTEDILKHLESEKHVNIKEEAKSRRFIMKSAFIIVLVLVWIGLLGILVYKSGFIKKFRSSEKTIAVKTEKSKEARPVISMKAVKEAEEKAREAAAVSSKEKAREKARETVSPPKETAAKNTTGPKNAAKDIKPDAKPKDNKEAPSVQFSGTELEKFIPPQNITLSELTLDPEKAKK